MPHTLTSHTVFVSMKQIDQIEESKFQDQLKSSWIVHRHSSTTLKVLGGSVVFSSLLDACYGLCRTTGKTEMFFPSSAWGKHTWDTAIIFSWKHSLQPKQVLDFLGSRFCQNSYVDLVIALRYLAEHKFTDVTFLLVPEMGSEVPGDLKNSFYRAILGGDFIK